MPRSKLEQIRDCVRHHRYDMSAHSMEEMAEDLLDIIDVEKAVLSGWIDRADKDDPRGVRFVVQGVGSDQQTKVGVVGRFVEGRRFLIITVYVVT